MNPLDLTISVGYVKVGRTIRCVGRYQNIPLQEREQKLPRSSFNYETRQLLLNIIQFFCSAYSILLKF